VGTLHRLRLRNTPVQRVYSKAFASISEQQNPETKKFTLLYGEQHLNNIIQGLQQIA